MFAGLGNIPSHFNHDLKISPEFLRGFFTYNQNFRMDSLHQHPPSPGIPRRIRKTLPAGKQQLKIRIKNFIHERQIKANLIDLTTFVITAEGCIV